MKPASIPATQQNPVGKVEEVFDSDSDTESESEIDKSSESESESGN
jgi:hypothetical protein